MAGQKFTLTFDAQLNVNQMKGALSQIQSTLNGLHLPQNIGKGLQGTFDKLSKEIQDFEVVASKDITGKADFRKLETQANKVLETFEKLKIQTRDLANLSGKDLEKLFPDSITKNIQNANKAVTSYSKQIENASAAVKKQTSIVNSLEKEYEKVQNKPLWTDEQKRTLSDTKNEIKALEEELTKAQTNLSNLRNKKTGQPLVSPKSSPDGRKYLNEINEITTKLEELKKKQLELEQTKGISITAGAQANKLLELSQKLTEAKTALTNFENAEKQLNSTSADGGLRQLLDTVGQITGLDMSKFEASAEGAGEAVRIYLNQQLQQLSTNLQGAQGSVDGMVPSIANLRDGMRSSAEAVAEFDTRINDINTLKTRIQYFFGLNNAIQLVKRTMRDAYQTIKDLDKAMTETAVVTNFSVGDMWAQLPEYTKRANELGVTTQAAYEAATLYYQQGLNTNEVMAMSNETLKMARIAGLEAAEATDRMTNAIRGFNMEINETNAQRIDDVYSRLAAVSASNTDEISTAMTKVASLAHNANMEFETTAAFLAQIIETTRESAETAGTALKTVVARFSEVKELYSEGDLKGQDEEGEIIDVNKVSQALRTAGIDLNKYFLGEVGLDDIFIELASKWDSLTTVQQRYIATQAAGSRQQSRFIALMSDYARTQELVGEAYNANGASAKQFAKTQESLQSKLAKLKNAWDEFAMGILNSDLVKAGVDLLTNFLNAINALTSGFGTLNGGIGGVISSLLKLGLVIGGLNLGKGLASGLFTSIGSIITGKPMENSFWQILSGASLGKNPAGFIGNLAGKGNLGTLLAGFLNPFSSLFGGIGEKINTFKANSAYDSQWFLNPKYQAARQNYFNVRRQNPMDLMGAKAARDQIALAKQEAMYGGVAPKTLFGAIGNRFLQTKLGGAVTLATALGGVAAAVGAIALAYKAWEKYTPEGQLKTAKKLAEKQEQIAQEARETAQNYKEVTEAYKQHSDAVDSATTTSERDTSIKERNEYLLSLIKQDKTYAQYLQSAMSDGGEIILTLNEKALAEAADQAAKAATDAAVKSYFANANQYGAEANVAENKLERDKINTERYSQAMNSTSDPSTMSWMFLGDEPISEAERASLTVSAELARRNQATQARLGYQELLKDSVSNKTLTSEVADSLATALGNIFKDTGELSVENFDNIIKLTSSSFNLQSLLSTISGDIDTNLLGIEDEKGLLEALGIDEASEDFQAFASYLGDDGEKILKDFIINIAKSNKELQENNKRRLQERLIDLGIISYSEQGRIFSTSPSQQQTYIDVLDQAESVLSETSYENLAKKLFDSATTEDQIKEIQDLINTINVDNPLASFDKLKKKIAEVSPEVQELFNNILNSDSLFNYNNLLKNSLSQVYEDVGEDIQDLVEENGKITPDKLNELAKKSETLSKLLDNNVVSARSLARALTAVGEGKISIDNINTSLLEVLDNMYTFDDLVEDVHNFIQGFDEGTDYGEGIDFFSSKLEELAELVDNFEFGNERTKNLWEALFGKNYLDVWKNQGEEGIRNTIEQWTELLKNDAYGFFTSEGARTQLGIEDLGNGLLRWEGLSDYKDIQDAANDLVDKFNISKTLAETLIQQFASHGDIDTYEAFQELSLKSAVNTFLDGGRKFWSEEELQQVADAAGIQYQDLVNRINEEGSDLVIYGKDNPLTGANLFKQFKEQLTLNEQDFEAWLNSFIDETTQNLDLTRLYSDLEQRGITGAARTDLVNSILQSDEAAGKVGEQELTLDNLRVNIAGIADVEPNAQVVTDIINGIQEKFKNLGEALTLTHLLVQAKASGMDFSGVDVPGILDALANVIKFGEDGSIQFIDIDKLQVILKELGFEQSDIDTLVGQAQTWVNDNIETELPTPNTTNFDNTIQGSINKIQGLIDKYREWLSTSAISPDYAEAAGLYGVADSSDIKEAISLGASQLRELGYNSGLQYIHSFSNEAVSQFQEAATEALNQLGLPGTISSGYTGNVQNGQQEIGLLVQFEDLSGTTSEAGALLDEIIQFSNEKPELGIVTNTEDLQNADEELQELTISLNDADGTTVTIYVPSNNIQTATAYLGVLINNIRTAQGLGSIPINFAFGAIRSGSSASGSIVSSHAAGTNKLSPGPALTGEEAPEIVWNKEKGYAYITGANGPEFRSLNAGDRIFNAEETRRILKNSKDNKLLGSFANGKDENARWRLEDENVSSNSDNDKDKTKWRNELDWLYNLLEDIAELERQQALYSEQHNQLLSDINATGYDLFKLTEKELDNLKEQLDNQQTLLLKRTEELQWWAGYAQSAGLGDYVQWNNEDQTIEIDWDKIEDLKFEDEETYNEITEIIDHLEEAQDQIDEAQSTMLDIQGQIQELENRYLQEFTDFQQRIYDAVVQQYQDQIDHLTSLNDTLNETNTSILNSLQQEIALSRQIRDNTKTENDIRDMEARLAYLRRDTTGANENAIRTLERQIEEARENYSDTLIDQSIDRLQESNEQAAEQRQQQIDLLTEQLSYWQENGGLWGEVSRLLEEGLGNDGSLIRGSELEQVLQNAEGWRAMSEQQREVWANELITAANQAGAYLIKIAEGFDDLAQAVWSTLPEHYRPSSDKEGVKKSYATGGLATRTGPAWLDGTVNEPEYVLNAKQTDAFLRLADVLPAMFDGNGATTNNFGGNVYVNLNMNVEEIASDYDVDRMVDRVKADIYSASNYRNVNAVHFAR